MHSSPLSGWNVSPVWVDRYLAVIGARHEVPSVAALAELTRKQILTIPFENITSRLRRAAQPSGPLPRPDAEELLANWEQQRGGGVCFQLTPMFCRLLQTLGYDATLILGQISFPGSHHSIMVDLEGQRYLADVGNGAPFFDPIPLDREVVVERTGLSYRFRPGDRDGEWWQDRLIHEQWTPFCRYELKPADESDLESGYQRHHTPGESWVVDRIRLVRCLENEILSLSDDELSRLTSAGKQSTSIEGAADYHRLVTDLFGLPALPILESVQSQAQVSGA